MGETFNLTSSAAGQRARGSIRPDAADREERNARKREICRARRAFVSFLNLSPLPFTQEITFSFYRRAN